MREADRQLIKEKGLEHYLEVSSIRQLSFGENVKGVLFTCWQPVCPEFTYIDGFEDSKGITNQEIREFLGRSLRFLESTQGISKINGVEYVHVSGDCLGEAFSSKTPEGEWTIYVYKTRKRKEQRRKKDFLFTVGHEIGHIFFKDHVPSELKKYWFWMFQYWVPSTEMSFQDETRSYNATECFADTVAELILKPETIQDWKKEVINKILFLTIEQTFEEQVPLAVRQP